MSASSSPSGDVLRNFFSKLGFPPKLKVPFQAKGNKAEFAPEDFKVTIGCCEEVAELVHDQWAMDKVHNGWTYGEQTSPEKHEHACLVPYSELREEQKARERKMILDALRTLARLGFKVRRRTGSKPVLPEMENQELWEGSVKPGYLLHRAPITTTTLTTKQAKVARLLAENACSNWAKERPTHLLSVSPLSSLNKDEMAQLDSSLQREVESWYMSPLTAAEMKSAADAFAALAQDQSDEHLHRAVVLIKMITALSYSIVPCKPLSTQQLPSPANRSGGPGGLARKDSRGRLTSVVMPSAIKEEELPGQ